MGQAKRRGTREQRVAEGIVKREAALARRRAETDALIADLERRRRAAGHSSWASIVISAAILGSMR